ncbi:copper resistance protein B [Komagataeibacter xylinus]|uniref:Copper resistance protein B n=1 Tax=Komagataeibacter xylinus TaxID=28448 RepID=A0A318Q070_KOMXY|nr:copper resistance protein B [Komagataeibacter xylinus]AZV38615.1 copper resistance protein B [Komagataeibacter xylinus]PYD56267.1 copper resistance protein B [Komagataeibacter xylinus]GBQ69727.1 copper resistance protein CopB [Komagataeibacter xylinus NBRC 15237]
MRRALPAAALLLLATALPAQAQSQAHSQAITTARKTTTATLRKPPPRAAYHAADAPTNAPVAYVGGMKPVMDQGRYLHGILDELEGRYAPGGTDFRWDGEAWYGGDYNRLWLKSEGTLEHGRLHDGDHELLYSRAVSPYWNVQAGVRADIDDGPTRTWGALGVQGLALYQFEFQATAYVSDRGRFASRIEGSYDFLLTNRLILQPQAEFNLYTKSDPARQVGAGLSDVDAGLRLRYEIWRKFAPYVAVSYAGYLTQARRIVHDQQGESGALRLTFGVRSWF